MCDYLVEDKMINSDRKVIIFGNSGSGKSVLARKLQSEGLAHLDLDTIAWDANPQPHRKPIYQSTELLNAFMSKHDAWVIEGCYSDLLALTTDSASEAIFMNLDVRLCIENATKRPWESHKYASKTAQDENLNMLIDWIKQYPIRTDTFSKSAHELLYGNFKGKKMMYTKNQP